MAEDRELQIHRDWLEPLQQVGLVVSPPALLKAGAVPQRTGLVELQERFAALLDAEKTRIVDFARFASEFLDWPEGKLVDDAAVIDELTVVLPEFEDRIAPTWAVPDADAEKGHLLLIEEWPFGTNLDKRTDRGWDASPQARHERLLREQEIPIGLLTNGGEIRLTYAPRGETSGHLTFPVGDMTTVLGRPFLAALHMLLEADRLFAGGRIQKTGRLAAILAESRKYQNEVSNILAEQVLAALNELLRGFQAADNQKNGALLDETFRHAPQDIYGGLLTTLLRLVFVLYTEDRGLMPTDEIYTRHYSVAGLFEKLRDDAGRHPDDLMDRRYGAWARLLTLFRLIHDGGHHERINLPPRHGELFNPDRYPFLEGRPYGNARNMVERLEPPRVSDGVIWRVLQNLLILDGERLSYRSLDVEQIGSVYEAMMGFGLERSTGRAIALRPKHIVVDLDAMLAMKPAERKKHLKDEAQCDITGQAETAVKKAETVEALVEALAKKISPTTLRILPKGSYFLQPGEERRRSGSHYTPRSLTEPIVRTTLRPIFEDMGANPKPEKILDLKVCDPAMGSGAFLVEACRQLAEKLVDAWQKHKCLPDIPPDEDPLLHARRVIAQRCLYGVDKNPFAVSLAKLSLWLITLAKDHAFTFLDHALKHGDSLVGLTREQIKAFTWEMPKGELPLFPGLDTGVKSALKYRTAIQDLKDENETEKRLRHKDAEDALFEARLAGDLIIAAFFAADKGKVRKEVLQKHRDQFRLWQDKHIPIQQVQAHIADLRDGEKPIPPFHWEIEFPEVFERKNPGFDAIVGNPPFFWGNRISRFLGDNYRDWLLSFYAGANGNGDLVAYFLRRGFDLIRNERLLGLITTNSISESDTRTTGLDYVLSIGGTIYEADRNCEWPGGASVRVAHVFIRKGEYIGPFRLDNSMVSRIGSDLREQKSDWTAVVLSERSGQSFKGVDFGGTGFILKAEARLKLLAIAPEEEKYIWPVLNATTFNSEIDQSSVDYIINFTGLALEQAEKAKECMKIVRALILPKRRTDKRKAYRERWWIYNEPRYGMYKTVSKMKKVLVGPVVSKYISFGFQKPRIVFTNALNVFAFETSSAFSVMQSRVHESWALNHKSTLESRTRYNPTDCFETFPFPVKWEDVTQLETTGRAYYEFRAALMVRNKEGLTDTYNRFHDPDERDPDILKLRELHAQMDRAVLDAYGWTDIPTDCEFILDYEIDEEEWGNKKKPYRYRWPDEVRDEVLARLLELNKQRAEEERTDGLTPAVQLEEEKEEDKEEAPAVARTSRKPRVIKLNSEQRRVLQEIVALLQLDPSTDDYDLVVQRHYEMNRSLFVNQDWATILTSGIASRLIKLETVGLSRRITLGEKAPAAIRSDVATAAKKAIEAVPRKTAAEPSYLIIYQRGFDHAVLVA